MPTYAPKMGFEASDSLNGETYQQNLQKTHPWAERRHMTYRLSTSVHRCNLCVKVRDEETKKRHLTVANWVFAETSHVIRLKSNFA